MSKFKDRLKELRLAKNLTQLQLAKAIGISQNAITCWETKKSEPLASTVIVLAQFFEVSVDYLLGLTD